GLEDYRNDLDVRAILSLAGGEDPEVRSLDERLKKMLTSDVRVWESAAGDPFWDFGYPRNAGEDLLDDLQAAGLVSKTARTRKRPQPDSTRASPLCPSHAAPPPLRRRCFRGRQARRRIVRPV